MINTYNESSLHQTLKTLYAEEFEGKTEVELHGHIYDILAEDTVIEIQTQNLGKLLPKTLDSLDHGLKVKIVYPLVTERIIETYDQEGELLSRRKSPKKESIYKLFDELTGIHPVLLNKAFSLDVVEVQTIEKRTKFPEPVQTQNKARRFRKDWIKTNKELKEIIRTTTFTTKEQYLDLIPKEVLPEFCTKDIARELKTKKELPASASKKAGIMVWVLRHMELITETGVKNRSHYYRIS